MNTQRRIFRGRSGPTDGRLPKQNARRRRSSTKQANKPAVNKYENDDNYGDQRPSNQDDEKHDDDDTATSLELVVIEEKPSSSAPPSPSLVVMDEPDADADADDDEELWRDEIKHLQKRIRNVQESIQTGTEGIGNIKIYKENVLNAVENCIHEWKSIRRHYSHQRVTEETETGATTAAAAVPVVETMEEEEGGGGDDDDDDDGNNDSQQQQLNGDNDNCGGSSGADSSQEEEEGEEEIIMHTPSSSSSSPQPLLAPSTNTTHISSESLIDPIITKETALQVFMLLQLSVQCGPLAGGKPGYFKRCGGEVAKIVEDYLNRVVPQHPPPPPPLLASHLSYSSYAQTTLAFSRKQADAIENWRRNAQKAAQLNKQPTKAALKKQSGKSKKKKLNKR